MKRLLILAILLFPSISSANEYAIKTIAYEASGESLKGQIAVASVIKTRAKQRKQSFKAVVLAKHQFSCWLNGKPTQKRKLSHNEISKATKAWNKSKVGKYNHYARYNISNYWTRKAKSKKRIGKHVFYQL